MYLAVTEQLKHLSKEEYLILRDQCHLAKNLTNAAIYNSRHHFFKTDKFLTYYKNYHLLKENENYQLLNSNMDQQTIKEVYGSFKSFFALRKLAKDDPDSAAKVRFSKYLEKDGFTTFEQMPIVVEE